MLVFDESRRDQDWTALYCALAPLLGLGNGHWSREGFVERYKSGRIVRRLLKRQSKQLNNVADWRAVESNVDKIKAEGRFLRVGDAIPTSKPQSMSEFLQMGMQRNRKYGGSLTVHQSISDFLAASADQKDTT